MSLEDRTPGIEMQAENKKLLNNCPDMYAAVGMQHKMWAEEEERHA